jgi:riboflavin synthase
LFTGLVEDRGVIRGIKKGHLSASLTIESDIVCEDLEVGDSVAVNGVCLTAASREGRIFFADVMAETLAKTNLGYLKEGDPVNLERALQVGGRVGGHFVTGHIDGVGEILNVSKRGISTEIWIKTPDGLEDYLTPQGSITLDGTSLTVAELRSTSFKVSLIPHTLEKTILGLKRANDLVNIEADILGKYVFYLLKKESRDEKEDFTVEFLAEHGFI